MDVIEYDIMQIEWFVAWICMRLDMRFRPIQDILILIKQSCYMTINVSKIPFIDIDLLRENWSFLIL